MGGKHSAFLSAPAVGSKLERGRTGLSDVAHGNTPAPAGVPTGHPRPMPNCHWFVQLSRRAACRRPSLADAFDQGQKLELTRATGRICPVEFLVNRCSKAYFELKSVTELNNGSNEQISIRHGRRTTPWQGIA